jgi:predicted dehydrogenase
VIKVGIVGIGKMGLSHHAMLNAHPEVNVVGLCDSSGMVLRTLKKYTGVATFSNFEVMLREAVPDAVIIATPSAAHGPMVKKALDRGIHVFCEKPFTLDPAESAELTDQATASGLVTQVGYHNRFIGTFGEVKRLLDAGAIGEVNHALGEAYGSVVTKPKGSTWRSQRSEGGGCLHDYAAHVIDLLTWYLGEPTGVGGTVLGSVFSTETDDEAYSTLYFDRSRTAQVAANWSDDSVRKMTTRVTIWGTQGRIYADRQECQVYLRTTAQPPVGYEHGWNVRYTTELTDPVWFYLRGEEYSAQLDDFVQRVHRAQPDGVNTFGSAAVTDRVISMLHADAMRSPSTTSGEGKSASGPAARSVGRPPRSRPGPARLRRMVGAVRPWGRNR